MKCKAICLNGNKCRNKALLSGYCVVHYNRIFTNPKEKKGLPDGCDICNRTKGCNMLKNNYVLGCSRRKELVKRKKRINGKRTD